MRKYLLPVLVVVLLGSTTGYGQTKCASYEAIRQQMAADPAYAKKVRESEKSFADYKRQTGFEQGKGKPQAITIPVVVHVVYNTAEQNISDAQVQSQIDVLNEDYTATNSDYNNYNAGYGGVKGDADIQFCLVQVIHKQTSHKSFPANNAMKFTSRGGSDAVDPMHILNFWVCNLGQNLLGYAYYPGAGPEIFGVACHYKAFGRGAQYNLFTDYNLGRTMTHEVGHCLGLAHIWGDATCGNDFVDDTPMHNTANFGCPGEGHLSTCTGTPLEMWMNYMDYTDDRCMYFLSDGQVARANFFIDTDPQLQSIIASTACGHHFDTEITNKGGSQPGKSISSLKVVQNEIAVYPSVTNAQVTLKITSATKQSVPINIYNQAGILVMKQQIVIPEGVSTHILNVGKLANDVYIIRLVQAGESMMTKFIVQH